MTRPRPASEAFLAQLPKATYDLFAPIISPLIDIVTLDAAPQIGTQDAAIFTSANGVQAAPPGQGRTAFCVGKATTKEAAAHGWTATQSGHDAESLVAALTTLKPHQRLFHLSGRHTRGNVAARLTDAGLNVTNLALYDQMLCDLSPEAIQALLNDARVIVPLFSPRTAHHFVRVAPKTASTHAVALSRAVAEALGDTPLAGLTIARHPDAKGMGVALGDLVHNT